MGGGTATDGLDSLRAVFGALWTAIGSVASTIASQPLLLIPLGILFAGAAIGLAKALMGTKRRGRGRR